ncbi:NDP-sugar synthase [bacterium]|nr:NDP-sugar synthase [bacterium]
MKTIKSAVILAAGFGTRLRPLTNHRAKPALPFFNFSLITHIINQLKSFGIEKIFINLHYQGWSVRRILRLEADLQISVVFSYEPQILGTAGALEPVKSHLRDKPFLLVNGDVLADIDLAAMTKAHFESGNAIATLAIHPASTSQGFPAIGSSNNNILARFPYGNLKNGIIAWEGTFTGMHIISPGIWEYIKKKKYQCINSGIYAQAIADGHHLATYRHDGYWNDIGTPERYYKAHEDVLCGQLKIFHNQRSIQKFWIAPTAKVDSSVKIRNTVVIGPDSIIQKNCTLENIIVWPGVNLCESSRLKNGILMKNNAFLSFNREGPE